jgi:2-dehydropantoate 2-reductase
MLQDIHHGKETEIRIINGAVSKIGRECNVPTPYNDLMCQLILARQSIYLNKGGTGIRNSCSNEMY